MVVESLVYFSWEAILNADIDYSSTGSIGNLASDLGKAFEVAP